MREAWWRRGWRRWLGRYAIDDPRPIAEASPYTYFLPSENELIALQPGDMVKLVIRSVPASLEYDAERMWVSITATGDTDLLHGRLENEPFDIPQLRPGAELTFRRSDVIDLIWAEDREQHPPSRPPRRWYWERCMVDDCVVRGESAVDYLYREAPDLTSDQDEFPDSGWRIRGTAEGVRSDERQGSTPQYVALGVVLNRDDSWLPLIDSPEDAKFTRDPTGQFVPVT